MITVITTYFNPCGFQARKDCFDAWKEHYKDFICVELAFDEAYTGSPLTFQGGSNNVMWQKEALLNIALRNLPKTCKYVAWIDNDILLPKGWDEIIPQTDFVQLFSSITIDNVEKKGYISSSGWGAPGGAWLARREKIPKLFERNIVGGGDVPLPDSLLNRRTESFWAKIPKSLVRANLRNILNGSVSYLDLKATHVDHGKNSNRQYVSRYSRIQKYHPYRDVRLNSDGVLEFSEFASKELKEGIRDYFIGRKEDLS